MAKAATVMQERDLDFMEQKMTKLRTKRFHAVFPPAGAGVAG
jgi:hypothetical protein